MCLRVLEGREGLALINGTQLMTAIGALVNYIMTNSTPAPSNINFGLLPPVSLTKEQRKGSKNKKKIKKMLCATRAAKIFDHFRGEQL